MQAVEPYNQRDHQHCFDIKNPPCGQKIEHLKCCLCELTNPIKSEVTVQKPPLGNGFIIRVRDQYTDNCLTVSDDEAKQIADQILIILASKS